MQLADFYFGILFLFLFFYYYYLAVLRTAVFSSVKSRFSSALNSTFESKTILFLFPPSRFVPDNYRGGEADT